METTIDQRLSRLEQEFDDFKHQVLELRPVRKDWRQTVGKMPDDALSRSAESLGSEWRKAANNDNS